MARTVFNMDPEWRFYLGDFEEEQKNTHTSSYNACKAGAAGGPEAKGFSDETWRLVDLPHDYYAESDFSPENLGSHGYRTRNNAWYRKTFSLDPSLEGKQIFLVFEGTAVNAEFYLNGSLMARSFSAYTETAFDITDRVYFDEAKANVLAVRINGFATEGWWYEGAGIYRHVKLYAKDTLHIAHNGVYAKPVLTPGTKNSWTVELETTVENSAYEAQGGVIRAELFDGDEKIATSLSAPFVCDYASKTVVNQKWKVSRPERWDVDNPKLYTVRVTVVKDGEDVDDEKVRIGFRTIEASPTEGFLLNGKKLVIKGVCCHQDHAGVGVAVPDSVQYFRIKRLKDMGVNGYRCSHNLPTKEVLDACDELGLVVMDENRRFEARDEVLAYLDIMVRRDRNHPSVVMWSMFNEEPLQNTEEGAKIYRRMKSVVTHLDDTRLLTGAINGSMEGAGLEMDITGINYNIHGLAKYHALHPDQPIIGSENNSAVTTRGCYKSDREVEQVLSNYDEEKVGWGQTVRETWDVVRKSEWLGGIFIWTGFDYRGEPTPFVYPSVSSQFGILDTCGFAKDAFYYNKACFDTKPMVHLLPHWNWKAGDVVRVAAPTNCDEVELFLNGKSLGRKAGDCIATPEWQVPFERGRLVARGYRNGKQVAKDEVRTAGKPYAIRATAFRTDLKGDGEDTAVIDLAVVDRYGVVVPDAANLLRFEVEGDGYLRGVGNGDPNSHESDVLPERHAYHGLCQALVTAAHAGKTLVFRATGDGLISDEIVFDVTPVTDDARITATVNYLIAGCRITPVLDARPDPLMEIADNDMNTLTPLIFNPSHQSDFHHGWRLYRIQTRLPGWGKYKLSFPCLIADKIEIYVNGKQILDRKTPFNAQGANLDEAFIVPFETDAAEMELRILIYMDDAPWGGIRDGVQVLKGL